MNKANWHGPLRVRLVLWTMTLNAALLLVLAFAGWIVLRKTQDQVLNDTLRLSAAQLVAAVDVSDGKFIVPLSDAAVLGERGISGWVLDQSGRVTVVVGQNINIQLSDIQLNQFAEQQRASGENIRLLRQPLAEASGSVVVGVSTLPVQQVSRSILLALAITMPLVLGLSAAGGSFLAGRALNPISKITAQARRIGRDNLSERLSLVGPHDEVRELAQTFDEMLERLQAAFENERRFTSDASHELRTPLGLLKAQITLALSRPRDAATLTTMIQAMERYSDRMTRLVERLLALARTEGATIEHAPVELQDLISTLIGQMNITANSRHINLRFDASRAQPAYVMGDSDQLTQLFLNLLDNAIRYCNEGGEVSIRMDHAERGYTIEITDTGVGISAEHLPHLFDRFYRADSSRTRQTGGTGLGLSIAQAIAKQHGGHITVQSALGEGSRFTVWLPENVNHIH